MSMPNKNQPLISASEAILQATQIAMQKDDKVFDKIVDLFDGEIIN